MKNETNIPPVPILETIRIPELQPHEFAQLLDALRRDARAETRAAEQSTGDARYEHEYNARATIRLLETLNPKAITEPRRDQCAYNPHNIGARPPHNHEQRAEQRSWGQDQHDHNPPSHGISEVTRILSKGF